MVVPVMLWIILADSNSENDSANSSSDADTGSSSAESNEAVDVSERAVDKQEQEIPKDLPTDSDWEDTYESSAESYSAGTRNNNNDSEMSGFEQADNSGQNLQDHLLWQLNLSTCSDTDRAIATTIIDAVGDDGYLSASLEDIHQSLAENNDIEQDAVEAVLHQVQDIDPPGVAARDLRECQ